MFYGALLLTGANLVLRLAGMSFQVYLSGRIGAAGVGLLQLVLSVRMLAFTLGSAGARTCSLYLSAEALGRRRSVRPALSGCMGYCALFSLAAAAGLWVLAPRIAGGWIGDAAGEPALRAFALFLPVGCLNGVMTGLFTAAGRLRTLVAVEFLEQGCGPACRWPWGPPPPRRRPWGPCGSSGGRGPPRAGETAPPGGGSSAWPFRWGWRTISGRG